MIFGRHTYDPSILYQSLLYSMTNTNLGPSGHGPSSQVLIKAAHIDNTGER